MILVLVWVYYSTQIFLLGAEFTKVYARPLRLAPRDDPSFRGGLGRLPRHAAVIARERRAMSQSIYMPMVAMVALIAVIWVRMYVVRIAEMRSRRIRTQSVATSTQAAAAFQNVAPADNFRNLFEVPVLFFVVCLALAASDRITPLQVTLAWFYVILRAMHSLIHVSYNRVMHRFLTYTASTIVLFLMWGLFALSVIPYASAAESMAPPARMQLGPEKPFEELPYTPSLDPAAMDRSANPCDDLYQYACGGWMKNNPIPPDQNRWDVYGKLSVDNQRYLWGILEDAAKFSANRTPTQQRIGDYFAACMDTDAVEKAGVSPLKDDLKRIDALRDKKALAPLLGDLHLRVCELRPVLRQRCAAGREGRHEADRRRRRGGPRASGSRLLREDRCEVGRDDAALRRARHDDVQAARRADAGGEGGCRHGHAHRDGAREGVAHQGGAARSVQDRITARRWLLCRSSRPASIGARTSRL